MWLLGDTPDRLPRDTFTTCGEALDWPKGCDDISEWIQSHIVCSGDTMNDMCSKSIFENKLIIIYTFCSPSIILLMICFQNWLMDVAAGRYPWPSTLSALMPLEVYTIKRPMHHWGFEVIGRVPQRALRALVYFVGTYCPMHPKLTLGCPTRG